MSLVGYVTVAEASEYIQLRYPSTDEQRALWEALTESDQAVYLQKAFDALETLPFRGRKYSEEQENAFPRWPNTEVPKAIKYAQIENALTLSDDTTSEETGFYDKMWRFGISSYSIGRVSETSVDGSWGHSRADGASSLQSTKARTLVQPYLMGGFGIE